MGKPASPAAASKVLFALLVVAVALGARSSAQTVSTPFVAGDILVKFRPGIAANARADAHRQGGGTPAGEIQRTGLQRVLVPPGAESSAIERYLRNPNVVSAEPNFVRSIPRPLVHDESFEVVPGDFHFDEQWALDNSGQGFYCIPWLTGELCLYSGTPDADIDAPEAWAITKGNSSVTVAVIDSGVDYTNPDLAANYAGGDDFVFMDGDPMDDHGHGTHVAGTIAAAMGNLTGAPGAAEGVAGVAPHARIKAYKVCRADGTCDDFAIQQAIARAIADGVNIINMSLGEAAYSQSLDEAVQDAWNAGLVIVAGAGNNGTTAPFYPAALNNVISVAAFDEDHRRPSFSNYGGWVDISAPGNVIMSTYPMSACGQSTTPGDMGCYTWNTGTSMATPHVAGAAALVWSRSDVTSNAQVVDILLNSADGTGVASVRLDSWTIHGGLNLHDAISYGLTNLPPLADAGVDQTVADDDGDGTAMVALDGSASLDRDGTITTYSWREGATTIGTGATPAIPLALGTHTLTLEVTDEDGDTATDDVTVTVTPANQVTVAASVSQANEAGTTMGVFTVSRTGATAAPLDVTYSVAGSAIAGTDYISLPGLVTIGAGSATATIAVTPIDDGTLENNESVILTLNPDAAYGVGSPSAATVTIVSDDLPPDLVVTVMTAPAAAAAGADIVVTDTTKNQGTGSALPSRTGLYLSFNSTLDTTDIWMGDRSVGSLAPGASDVVSTTVRVPATTVAGSYYVLAKADWDSTLAEGVETNNTRASGLIKIGPDLIISAMSIPDTAAAGAPISASDTTKNQGAGAAAASTTRFYLSANSLLDAADILLGSRSAPPLASGASDVVNTSLVIPSNTATGTYYVIAQADSSAAVPESAESNNNRASGLVRIGPDLLVTALTAPATAGAGATISIADTTKNQGAGLAAASSTGFYLSTNSTIDGTDVFLGSRSTGDLTGGAMTTVSTQLQIPANTAAGSYYVIARADWTGAVSETIETNNNKYSGIVKVGADLTVTSVSVPATAKANGSITVTDTTKNQGAPVPSSSTGFYLSGNSSFDATDVFLGSRPVAALATSATSTASTLLVIPAETASGTYWVVAIADWDGAIAETAENNNIRVSGTLRVGPDMVVSSLSAPSSAAAGTTVTASDTTKNQGGDTAPASTTTYHLSADNLLDEGDTFLASRAVAALAPAQSSTGSVSIAVPASTVPGTYYIIAASDDDGTIIESLENNNTRTRTISITAPSP